MNLTATHIVPLLAGTVLAACGGGNPPSVENPPTTSGQKLSFIYFQKCINPVFLAPLKIDQGGVISTNTCASGGCHDTTTGTGCALRLVQSDDEVDVSQAAELIRATDMYKNFYSAQGAAVIGAATQSRLLNKPLLQGVLHGGGLIFETAADPNAKLISYWINHPSPEGQDEFSSAGNGLFDPATGACKTE